MKSDKLKQIKALLQPPQPKTDKIYIHNPNGEPVFHSELQGSGHDVIVSTLNSIDVLRKLNSMQ